MGPHMLIIAVSGQLGTGKDYITEHFIRPLLGPKDVNVTHVAFADPLKIMAASCLHLPIKRLLIGPKTREERDTLQKLGTEKGRDVYGNNIWIDYLENSLELRQIRGEALDVVLITDCRFPNEADWITKRGGLLIRVEAPDRHSAALKETCCEEAQGQHISEHALNDYIFKYKVDNSVGADVPAQLKTIVQDYVAEHLDKAGYFGGIGLAKSMDKDKD